MQNREELREKGHDGSRKTTCCERGKKYNFQKGGGINIVFVPKYRPLGPGFGLKINQSKGTQTFVFLVAEEAHEKLAVADAKLGNSIKVRSRGCWSFYIVSSVN